MNKLKNIILVTIFLLISTISYSKIETQAKHVILQDHLSGKILYEKEADGKIYPASMTKIMTTIVTFDLLKKGETSLDEEIVRNDGVLSINNIEDCEICCRPIEINYEVSKNEVTRFEASCS